MWEARATDISVVDQSGRFTVRFDIYVDGVLKYSNLETTGLTKAEIVANIKAIGANLKAANTQAASISVGDKVNL